jgi:hypothetical protein
MEREWSSVRVLRIQVNSVKVNNGSATNCLNEILHEHSVPMDGFVKNDGEQFLQLVS